MFFSFSFLNLLIYILPYKSYHSTNDKLSQKSNVFYLDDKRTILNVKIESRTIEYPVKQTQLDRDKISLMT